MEQDDCWGGKEISDVEMEHKYSLRNNIWLVVLCGLDKADWSPGVVALPDRRRVLVAERQEVEELSYIEQGFDVVLKGVMSHSWERDTRKRVIFSLFIRHLSHFFNVHVNNNPMSHWQLNILKGRRNVTPSSNRKWQAFILKPTRHAGVSFGSSQLFLSDVFVGDGFHHIRSCDEQIWRVLKTNRHAHAENPIL